MKVNNKEMPLVAGGLSKAKDILPLLPFGRTTLWRKCKDGKFPEPQRINASVTVWKNDEVNAWLENPMQWQAE
ncbi:helix-turn-helix transcriptional regulator [Moraxella sp. ZY200743]|uniref:helix-turn-helix transcriptional regulator n=1 Tax=Moraxella sp. ZY200743 TaxID=2911970 RepID=UPI003D7ED6F1